MAVLSRFARVEHSAQRPVRALDLVGDGEEDALAASARAARQEAGRVEQDAAIRKLDQLRSL